MEKQTRSLSIALGAWALGLVALACDGSSPTAPGSPPAPQPAWVSALIAEMQSQPVTSPPSSLYAYRYQGATVYFRPARCCDVMSDLFDASGSRICHPDGGFGGGGDGLCTDFFAQRSGEELVWHDPRP